MSSHHKHGHAPLGGRLVTPATFFLAALSALAFALIGVRFVEGIGAVTNINDGYTWGIWVTVDVVIGTAIGCAGYVIALLVYILNRGEYHPLVRPAVMASLFGYGLGGLAVLIDLGRWWQAYNMFLPQYMNFNSVMLEVGLCVAAYVTVLAIEFSPAFLERLGMKNARRALGKVLFFFIALGVLLPTMHQSSLGTMLVLAGHKLSPLWQTPALPVLFLASALCMGCAVVIFESVLSSTGFKREAETPILAKLSGLMAWLIAAILVVRFGDLVNRDALHLAFAGDVKALMFWIENIAYLVSLVLLLSTENRSSPQSLFMAAVSMLLGGMLFRLNAYIIGITPAAGWHYFPSVPEIMVTVGIFAFEILLYIVFVKTLPVLPKAENTGPAVIRKDIQAPALSGAE